MRSKLRFVAVLFAVALALAWNLPAVGQVLKGSISGTVVDPQGAVVSGAEVQAKNVETGGVFSTTSDSSGLYRLNLLPAGTYNVTITSKGFKTTETKNLAVTAAQDQGMGSVKLNIGGATETVEVTASAPLIETTQSQITNTFTGTTLTKFAGVQENEGLDRLALFVPGVVASRSDNFSNTNGIGFSSNGLRGRNNDQEVDGQNNNDNSVAGPGLFLTDTEFVGQYVLVTNNFGPEYGRNSGSVVNILTKSGTNGWHGSVYGQDRSSFLDAETNTERNTPQPGTVPPAPFNGPPRFNEEFSGGTIGGPIVKNKAFLFGGFDSDLFSGSTVYTTTSVFPTPAGLAKLASCGVNATALNIAEKFGPYAFSFGNPVARPVGPGGAFTYQTIGTCAAANSLDTNGVQVGGVTRDVNTPGHVFDFVLKHDLQLGGDSVTARYLFNRNNTFNTNSSGTSNAAGGWTNNVPALSQVMLLSWTHNFSSRMVNEARVSFGRLNVDFGGGLNSLLPTAGNLLDAFTNISFSAAGTLPIGPATNIPQSRLVNTWQGQDNWNYVLGKHSLKAGVNWTYQRSPNTFLPDIDGAYRFTSLNSFFTTDIANRIQIAQGTPTLDFREYDTFLYGGDDWKIGQHLTLNLGLTWTYYGQPDNLFNQLTAPREANPATAFWLQSLPASVTTDATIPSVKNSFGPSVGFAYSPQWGGFLHRLIGDNKTTIRGGYRLSYDPPYYNIFLNQASSSPMTFLQTITDAPTLTANPLMANPVGPNVRAGLAAAIAPNKFDPRTQNETNITPDFGPDKVNSWSLGFEREVTKNAALEVRYVGNHGYNLFETVDGNPYVGTPKAAGLPGPGQLQAGFLPPGTPSCTTTAQSGPGAGTDLGRLACGLGVVRTRANSGFSDYDALQTEFRANNLFKQLTIRAGYTYSKTLDNVSEIFATGTAGNTLFAAQNPFDINGPERSTSGLSIPNTFTLIAVEQVPFFKEQHGLLGHILGGFSLSASYIWASGQPYTPEQALEEALSQSQFGNVYDSSWVNAFVGTDVARPFMGSTNAAINSVGVFVGPQVPTTNPVGTQAQACTTTNGGCSAAEKTALALLPLNQLVSLNALNQGSVQTVTNNQVRYIINSGEAQTVFGTPFGNMPRNPARDAPTNLLNTTLYKNIKLGEKANFEMHITLNNALNHFNFNTVDPIIEQAGVGTFNNDFANPSLTATTLNTFGYRTIWVGGKISF